MQIGELAGQVGVTAKTVRYYEEIGLLPTPDRAPNGYRDYQSDAVGRLRFIRDAQDTGLTLTEIASILDLRDHGETTCDHVVGLLERHLEDLDRHIETLQQTRVKLAVLTKRAEQLNPADCIDPNRCQTIEAGPHLGALAGRGVTHVHAAPGHHSHG
ncbi:MAG: heavy metal-responsive transcriptional regulator [Acidimicrobiia bacterium]|nr:heavy metal-responsive transcriptional regulator [Acidimicrobiia bacterium]